MPNIRDYLEELLSGRLSDRISALEKKWRKVMAQIDDLKQAVADVKQAAQDEATRVDAIIAQLSNPNPDLSSAISDLNTVRDNLRGFHADTPTPTP